MNNVFFSLVLVSFLPQSLSFTKRVDIGFFAKGVLKLSSLENIVWKCNKAIFSHTRVFINYKINKVLIQKNDTEKYGIVNIGFINE